MRRKLRTIDKGLTTTVTPVGSLTGVSVKVESKGISAWKRFLTYRTTERLFTTVGTKMI